MAVTRHHEDLQSPGVKDLNPTGQPQLFLPSWDRQISNGLKRLKDLGTYQKLKKQSDLKSTELLMKIEQVLLNTAKQYFDIAFLQEQNRILYELLEVSKEILNENKNFKPPEELRFKLPGKAVRGEMDKILEKLYNDKIILDHGVVVAKELAHVLSGGDTTIDKTLSEDDLFKLELDAFMRLIETPKTQDRIKHTLTTGKPLVN